MFKPTAPLLGRIRRLRLTTKQVNGGYYKGNRTGPMGWHTKHGDYILDWDRVRTYVVPEGLDFFKLTPFVSKQIEPQKGSYKYRGKLEGPMSGTRFLERWKTENGRD